MKRICLFLLAAVLLLNLTGCGTAGPDPQEENFSFTYNGIQITPGGEAAPVIEALGEPLSYTEEPSCAFDGLDKTYYYGSFYLATCPLDGRDCIYDLWFADDTVATEEGIRIGSTRESLEAVWGADSISADTLALTRGNTRLTVLLDGGLVSSVRYQVMIP